MSTEQNFNPDEFEQMAKPSGYFKPQDGASTIRILSATPTKGWEWWVDSDGEVRGKNDKAQKGDRPKRVKKDGRVPMAAQNVVRGFWALLIWNYEYNRVQIWMVNRLDLQGYLRGLFTSKSWGDPRNYDVTIVKSGEKQNITYSVTPEAKSELSADIQDAIKNTPVNMDGLFDDSDPFNPSVEEVKDSDLDELAAAFN